MARKIFQGQAPTSAQSGVMSSWNAEIEGVCGLLSALSQPDELASWFYFHFLWKNDKFALFFRRLDLVIPKTLKIISIMWHHMNRH